MKKRLLKFNILSLFCIGVSLLSITLAWFAYSGLASASTEVDVKAWYVQFTKDNQAVSNEIVLALSDIYPGMDPITERVSINNLGDTDAQLSYDITSARILESELKNDTISSEEIEDTLSHDFPFHININLSKNYVGAHDDMSEFEVSVSWPLDSANNELDSEWGNQAYAFQQKENAKKEEDESYEVRSTVHIAIDVKAEQFVVDNESSDMDYNLGDLILYNVVSNQTCDTLSSTCLKTYVIDTNNKIGDTSVTLLPDLFHTYVTGNYASYASSLSSVTSTWTVPTRALTLEDLLPIIAKDVENSYVVRENLSNVVIGNLSYGDRFATEVLKVVAGGGYYQFSNQRFPYLMSSKCYWINTDYNATQAFSLVKVDDNLSKIYGEDKAAECSVVPVIEVAKSSLT